MNGASPCLDTLTDLTAAAIEHNALAPRELMLVRMAALIAVDAPPASYLVNAKAAGESGLTVDDIQAVMIGVASVVGTARGPSAGGQDLRARGLASALAQSQLARPGAADEEHVHDLHER